MSFARLLRIFVGVSLSFDARIWDEGANYDIERVRDIEYESISNAGASNYGHSLGRRHRDRSMHRDDLSDSRTEIIIESGADRPRRRYYH
jgi:hypothetical protein